MTSKGRPARLPLQDEPEQDMRSSRNEYYAEFGKRFAPPAAVMDCKRGWDRLLLRTGPGDRRDWLVEALQMETRGGNHRSNQDVVMSS